MRAKWLPPAISICLLTLLTYFQFPGHTYLQSDTQIYAPILEHLRDPSVLQKDMVVKRPHVAFTLYDEIAQGLRTVFGVDLRAALTSVQVICRALGIWGLYMTASAMGLGTAAALLVAAILSLGATIVGPSVLSFEYEPVPRGFAVPLLFLAIGQAAKHRYLASGIAGSVAFLIHPPTVYPFWAVYFVYALAPARRIKLRALLPLGAAIVALCIAALAQSGAGESHEFFQRIAPDQERLLRLRASYNWVSGWFASAFPHYAALYVATLLLTARVWDSTPRALRFFFLGLPLIAMLSMPLSYLLLERVKWILIPQVQPMRALLFLTVTAGLLAAVAGCRAAAGAQWWEAIPCFALAYLIPVNTKVWEVPPAHRVALVLSLSVLAAAAMWADARKFRWAGAAAAAVAVIAFFAVPSYGKVRNYPALHSAELNALADWARTATPKSAVFAFPDADKDQHPGVFRAFSLRSVYVDWKGGGQANYFRDLGEIWWSRWQTVMVEPMDLGQMDRYAAMGIDYVVVKAEHARANLTPVFRNDKFIVYKTGS